VGSFFAICKYLLRASLPTSRANARLSEGGRSWADAELWEDAENLAEQRYAVKDFIP
jgi:predicted ATPase